MKTRPFILSLSFAMFVACLALGCESPGYTPDCPPMPITNDGPNSAEIVAWRAEAVPKGCATAAYSKDALGGAGGGAGASN